jgi:hypothetical protein
LGIPFLKRWQRIIFLLLFCIRQVKRWARCTKFLKASFHVPLSAESFLFYFLTQMSAESLSLLVCVCTNICKQASKLFHQSFSHSSWSINSNITVNTKATNSDQISSLLLTSFQCSPKKKILVWLLFPPDWHSTQNHLETSESK